MNVDIQIIRSGFDGETCWVNPWCGVADDGKTAVLTMQKILLSGSDVFFGAHAAWSDDRGETFSPLTSIPSMARRTEDDGRESCVNDLKPHWHDASGSMLGISVRVFYTNADHPDHTSPGGRPPETVYATWDPTTRKWGAPRTLSIPDHPHGDVAVAGSVQRLERNNGRILLPLSCRLRDEKVRTTCVAECEFDGEKLEVLRLGNGLSVDVARGLYEPSVARVGNRYVLTMRNDEKGYVAVSKDGLEFQQLKPWTFDDGEELGNYNTQQHWVTREDRTWLIYTRRGLNNDHVFRHRAPLMMAEVDLDSMTVRRETERVLVPERGARMGNFGVTRVDENETWVTAAEWMQPVGCEEHGSDNRVYLVRITWD
ncbi:MAG: exo-alpha-sialidase [Planctomycetota bacterium]